MDNNSLLYKIRYRDTALSKKNLAWRIVCKGMYQNYIKSTDVVLDVASGHGEFINNIVAEKKLALDLNYEASDYLNSDVKFYHMDAFEIGNVFQNLDVILAANFLEHLADKRNLDKFLKIAHDTLKPGGRLLIVGPNLRYVPGKYWDYYDHNIGLTHFSLMEALELQGFRIQKCIDKFLPHLDRGSSMATPLIFIRLYLKFPLIWRLMGSQFFIVAEKPFATQP